MHSPFTSMLNRSIWIEEFNGEINFLMVNFVTNHIYLYDDQAFILKKYHYQQNSSWLYEHSVYCSINVITYIYNPGKLQYQHPLFSATYKNLSKLLDKKLALLIIWFAIRIAK